MVFVILSQLLSSPVCVAAPLFQISKLPFGQRRREALSELWDAFTVVAQRLPSASPVVMFEVERIEQIQFIQVSNVHRQLGLVNHFYHSNIIKSS